MSLESFKVLLVGDEKCGKTTLLSFVARPIQQRYRSPLRS